MKPLYTSIVQYIKKYEFKGNHKFYYKINTTFANDSLALLEEICNYIYVNNLDVKISGALMSFSYSDTVKFSLSYVEMDENRWHFAPEKFKSKYGFYLELSDTTIISDRHTTSRLFPGCILKSLPDEIKAWLSLKGFNVEELSE